MNTVRLVDDLIPVILELNDTKWWPCDLQRLALVSPAWVGPVRRRLYECPVLHTFQSCNLLARTLAGNPALCELVHGLNLRPASSRLPYQGLSGKNTASLRVLLNLKGLQSLTLGGSLAAHAERFLHMMTHARSVTALHIDGSHLRSFLDDCSQTASVEWSELLAFRFPRLSCLHLSNIALSIAHPSLPHPPSIEQLVLDNVVIVAGLLQHLCHESWQSIRMLHITTKQTLGEEDQLHEILESCERLESFSYEVDGKQQPDVVFEQVFPSVPSLKRLKLAHLDVTPRSLELIGSLFERLEELSISGRSARITPGEWAGFIRSQSLRSLKVLTTSLGTNIPPFTPWTKEMKDCVLDACASCNIVLI
ncbi:hypothetical protein BXZ70DRAFT_937968 [Cristinia sonorae]|uniref:F-box domain-containing protein n=1 Tax=Cristinia sonorae TaxID=1940300 RepID=A0A8K0UNG7_9AGAR|nr:hypothetical protein BXZ70DRAFT_937968 [Cristinia sonorae]